MRFLTIVAAAGAYASALTAQTPQVNCAKKLSESRVEFLLSNGVSQGRVERFVRTCGIGFEVTPATAAQLRRAGARSALISVLRENQPRPPETPAPSRAPTRGNPKDGLTYVWIPSGTFKMGCSAGDNECDKTDEYPAHDVTITKGFWIGQTE